MIENKYSEHDKENDENKLKKLHKWWYDARSIHDLNRYEQAVDDDFVDGIQWTEEEKKILQSRNQSPLVFNEILPAIQWILGTEKRTKIDWKVLPRLNDDVQTADIKTKLLKYINDVNKASFVRSNAFEDAVRTGIGWLEVGISQDKEKEILFFRNENWRNMWLDPLSTELDLSDARYVFRSKVLDLDTAQLLFPENSDDLKHAAIDRDSYGIGIDGNEEDLHDIASHQSYLATYNGFLNEQNSRQLVRLVECWYREPSKVQVIRGIPRYEGMIFNSDDEGMQEALLNRASLVNAVKMQVRLAVFIEGGELCQDVRSPYYHNRFPFIPVFGYKRKRDNLSYGVVRNIRDPQSDLNKRRSKALFVLSTNRTIMDEGAVADLNDFEEEVARPDSIIIKKQGKSLDIQSDKSLAREHIMLAQQDADYVRQSAGVTGENLGMETNATSGKAILARQNQGTVITVTLFDNLRLATQLSGEIILSLVEQFYTEEKTFRLTGKRGEQDFVGINQYDPATAGLNDITEFQSDFVVSEQDYRESMRLSMFDQMMTMISQMDSQIALQFLDLVIEWSDLPGKEEMVKRIRKINGQVDPNDEDAGAKAENLQVEQAEQARQAAELAQRQVDAELQEQESKSQKAFAEAQRIKVQTMTEAFNAAIDVLQEPSAIVMAQKIMEGADISRPGSQ